MTTSSVPRIDSIGIVTRSPISDWQVGRAGMVMIGKSNWRPSNWGRCTEI